MARHQTPSRSTLDGGGGRGTVGTVGDAIGAVGVVTTGLLPNLPRGHVLVILDVETEIGGGDAAVSEQQDGAEDRLGEDVEDTIKDGLAVRGDDVSALSQTPGDGVQEPQEDGEDTAAEERPADLRAESGSVSAGDEDQDIHDVEEGEASKDEVSPLVAGVGEGSNEAGDDHHFVDQDSDHDRWPWHASGQEQIGEQ